MISVRTMREFLDHIAVLYDKAKRRSYNVDKRVVKGRARCIAAQTEEAFANFACQSILGKKHGFKVLVDFPIRAMPECWRHCSRMLNPSRNSDWIGGVDGV